MGASRSLPDLLRMRPQQVTKLLCFGRGVLVGSSRWGTTLSCEIWLLCLPHEGWAVHCLPHQDLSSFCPGVMVKTSFCSLTASVGSPSQGNGGDKGALAPRRMLLGRGSASASPPAPAAPQRRAVTLPSLLPCRWLSKHNAAQPAGGRGTSSQLR